MINRIKNLGEYGKKGHISWNKGIDSRPTCIDCGKKCSYCSKMRCKTCRMKGENHPMFGKHHSQETKKIMSEAKLKNPTRYWLGKKFSESHKQKISENSPKNGYIDGRFTDDPKEYFRKHSEEWRVNHPGKAYLAIKKWREKNIDLTYYWNMQREIKKLRVEGSHTFEEWLELKHKYNCTCLKCKRQEPEIRITEDHIRPLSKGGSDYIENIQPLCRSCNSSKGVKEVAFL